MLLGAVIGTLECGIPVIPTLILSVLSLEKEGLRAAGTFKPPLPLGALPGLAVCPVAPLFELLMLIMILLLIVVFPCFPLMPVVAP